MEIQKIRVWMRIILALCGVALVAVLYLPMWRIDLEAPQYPEGLFLLIYPDKLGGNVEIINGLNHYIGMKTLHTADFIEFKILPFLILGFSIGFFLVAAMGRRRWMTILFIMFVLFGVVAMVDFWKWEYNYGHNLDPNAAIIVPGMSYQPPLIGFKQLLNFGAYSIPDKGGWIFIGVGLLLLTCVILAYRKTKIKK
jgi:copper chaperone NosL